MAIRARFVSRAYPAAAGTGIVWLSLVVVLVEKDALLLRYAHLVQTKPVDRSGVMIPGETLSVTGFSVSWRR